MEALLTIFRSSLLRSGSNVGFGFFYRPEAREIEIVVCVYSIAPLPVRLAASVCDVPAMLAALGPADQYLSRCVPGAGSAGVDAAFLLKRYTSLVRTAALRRGEGHSRRFGV